MNRKEILRVARLLQETRTKLNEFRQKLLTENVTREELIQKMGNPEATAERIAMKLRKYLGVPSVVSVAKYYGYDARSFVKDLLKMAKSMHIEHKELLKEALRVLEETEGDSFFYTEAIALLDEGGETVAEAREKDWVSKVKREAGHMKEVLGIPEDEDIVDHYKDHRKLVRDLLKKVSYKEAVGMLAFAANVNPEHNIYDQALKYIKELKKRKLVEAKKKEKWIQKAFKSGKVKRGKMHEVLGIPKDKDIDDVYKSGESLARALIRKVGRERAMKMINFAVNTSNKRVFKSARAYLKRTEKNNKKKQ